MRRHGAMLLFVFGAIVVRAAFLLYSLDDAAFRFPQSDQEIYLRLGALLRHGDFFNPQYLYTSPLYPLVVAGFATPLALTLLQMTCGVIATIAVVGLARQHYRNRDAGLYAGMLFTLHGPLIFYETKVYPTALTIDALLVGLWLIQSVRHTIGIRSYKTKLWLGGTALAFAGGLTSALLPLYAAVPWLIPKDRRRIGTIIVALPFAVLLAVLGWRSYKIDGAFMPMGAYSGLNLAQGHHPEADGTHYTLPGFDGTKLNQQRDARHLAELKIGKGATWKQIDSYWNREAWSYITGNPGHELRLLGRKLMLFFTEASSSLDISFAYDRQRLPPLRPLVVAYTLLLCLAFLSLFSGRSWPKGVIAGFTSILVGNLLFFVSERYRLPAAALLSVPAGAGLLWIWKSRARTSIALRAGVAALLLLTNFFSTPSPSEQKVNDYNLALAHEQAGHYETAIALIRPIHALKQSPVAAHTLIRLLLKQQKIDEAQKIGESTVAARGETPDLMNDLGVIHLRRNEFARAAAYLDRAVILAPDMALAYRNRARAESGLHRYNAALAWQLKYTQLRSTDWRGWTDLARVYLQLDRFDEADAALERAKALGSSEPEADFSIVITAQLIKDGRETKK